MQDQGPSGVWGSDAPKPAATCPGFFCWLRGLFGGGSGTGGNPPGPGQGRDPLEPGWDSAWGSFSIQAASARAGINNTAQNQNVQSYGNVELTTITYAPNNDNDGVNVLLGANVKNSSDEEFNWIQSITTNAPLPGRPANTPYLDTPPVGAPTIFYYHSGDMALFARHFNTTNYSATFFDGPFKPLSSYPNLSKTSFHASLRLVGINSEGKYHTLLRLTYGFTVDAKGVHPELLRILP